MYSGRSTSFIEEEKCLQQSNHDGDLSIRERIHRLRDRLQMLQNQHPDKREKNGIEGLGEDDDDWGDWDDFL